MRITLTYNTELTETNNSTIIFDNELQKAVKKLNEPESKLHEWLAELLEETTILSSKIEFKLDFVNNDIYCVITYILEANISDNELEKLIDATSDQLVDGYGENDWEIKSINNNLIIKVDNSSDRVYPFEIKKIKSRKTETKSGINPNICSKKIEKAVETGNIELVQKFLEEGGNVNCIGKWEQTLLVKAIQSNQEKIALLLIENGADLNYKDNEEQRSLLFKTVFHSLTNIAQILIDKGVDVNSVCRHGATALMFASTLNKMEMVKLFVENGADATIKDHYGRDASTTDHEIFLYLKEIKSKQSS